MSTVRTRRRIWLGLIASVVLAAAVIWVVHLFYFSGLDQPHLDSPTGAVPYTGAPYSRSTMSGTPPSR